MTFFSSTSVAADAPTTDSPQSPPLLMNFLPFVLIFLVFYMLVIRPQMKKQKEHQEMISSITRGEKIVTGGGIVGTVVKVEEDDSDILHVEIAPGVKIQVVKSTVTAVKNRTPKAEKPSKSTAKKEEDKGQKS